MRPKCQLREQNIQSLVPTGEEGDKNMLQADEQLETKNWSTASEPPPGACSVDHLAGDERQPGKKK
jgi:hypothetical protein